MKTTWSLDYLQKKLAPHETGECLNAKCAAYAKKTGVEWSWSRYAGKAVLLPNIGKSTPLLETADGNDAEIQAIVDFLAKQPIGGTSFLRIANETGLKLSQVLTLCKFLTAMQGRLSADVNRMGKWCFCSLRK